MLALAGRVHGLDEDVDVEGAQWNDRLSRVEHKTLIKLSETLGVPIGELFANNMGKKGNGGEDSKNGNVVEVVESNEENKVPALIEELSTQSARGGKVIPAFERLPTEQTRVPYRKAA